MMIEAMEATFGKLDAKTLTLQPGLNILQMPNEAGKSTWCAFLISMLYGVDTSERATKTNFPIKKHYAPWSGQPMEGRIRLQWQGRRITIERTGTARNPMGVFRAYDTESGQLIPELTAQNCGEVLLGIPRQVFERSAFVRQDGAAIQMEATLEQRLSALVSTGEEGISFQQAEKLLHDRMNHCRHNKTGQIPQLQSELSGVEERLHRLEALHDDGASLESEQTKLEQQLSLWRKQMGAFQAKALNDRRAQVLQAQLAMEVDAQAASHLEQQCADLPKLEDLQAMERSHRTLSDRQATLAMDLASLPELPAMPQIPARLRDLTVQEQKQRAKEDAQTVENYQKAKMPSLAKMVIPVLGIEGVSALLFYYVNLYLGAGLALAGLILALVMLFTHFSKKKAWSAGQAMLGQLLESYGIEEESASIEAVTEDAILAQQTWNIQKSQYETERASLQAAQGALQEEICALRQTMTTAFGQEIPWEQAGAVLRDAMERQYALENAKRTLSQSKAHFSAMEKTVEGISLPHTDCPVPTNTTLPELQTKLAQGERDLARIRSQYDRIQGRCATLGDSMELTAKKETLENRIAALEEEYTALSMALTAMGKANEALQSRFAPQLTKLTEDYLCKLTEGAYSRLVLDKTLSASVYPRGIPTLREGAYLSGGTQDQMYLAMRLAVSRLLCKEAPLVLDDALVRFDDQRLALALSLLQKENRQILLFTCQSREQQIAEQLRNQT